MLNVQDASLRWDIRGIEITDFRTLIGVARKGYVASQLGYERLDLRKETDAPPLSATYRAGAERVQIGFSIAGGRSCV